MKLDRLMGILTVLMQFDRVTAPYLAERFEVSRRTINRDIDALCRAGIPVVTQQGSNGGISIAEGFKLDKSVLTSDELASLIAAVKGIGTVGNESEMRRTLDKLSPTGDQVVSLKESIVIDLASHYRGSLTQKIELIKRAIRERRQIAFDYYYEKGESRRVLEPYLVVFQWTAWYVFGYCPLRQDFRLFKLARSWNLALLDEGYAPREIPEEKLDLNARFTDHLTLTALFDPSARYQLIEAYGLDCYTETENGQLLFEVGYTNEDYMMGWLLAFGGKVKVLSPTSLAEKIQREAARILENYSH